MLRSVLAATAIGLTLFGASLMNVAVAAVPVNPRSTASVPAGQQHIIGAAKLIVGDLKSERQFFTDVFGMKEISRYEGKGVYDEAIMSFEHGAGLALFHPLAEAAVPKSQFPVALIYTPDLDGVVSRLQAGHYKFQRLPPAQSGTFDIAIARDPSGNAIEIFHRKDQPYEVGGAKLIVNDRQKAEDFYAQIFGAKAGQRYVTPTYDEVLMQFGKGPFLALFQPKAEAPLKKSQFPVVAIYTAEFNAVLQRIEKAGFGYRDVKTDSPDVRIIIAKDPAGNAVEIIRRARKKSPQS